MPRIGKTVIKKNLKKNKGESMKVGIITVYEPTTNLGSFLQTYALQEVLKSYGNDVYIVQKSFYKRIYSQSGF